MAAACGFVVAPNITTNTPTLRPAMVSFSTKNKFNQSRLVALAADGRLEPADAQPDPEPAEEAKAEAKPAPVGPPRGAKVSKHQYTY